jgi:hypothetical protein
MLADSIMTQQPATGVWFSARLFVNTMLATVRAKRISSKDMGWLRNRLRGHLIEIPKLWDQMRDCIGEAARDLAEATASTSSLEADACKARGKYCVRIRKTPGGGSVEVYLDESTRSLNVSLDNDPTKTRKVCGYRLSPEADRGAEFFTEDASGMKQSISVDTACELAIGTFILTPFPPVDRKIAL